MNDEAGPTAAMALGSRGGETGVTLTVTAGIAFELPETLAMASGIGDEKLEVIDEEAVELSSGAVCAGEVFGGAAVRAAEVIVARAVERANDTLMLEDVPPEAPSFESCGRQEHRCLEFEHCKYFTGNW